MIRGLIIWSTDILLAIVIGIFTSTVGRLFYDAIIKAKSLLPISNIRKIALKKTWVGSFLMPSHDGSFEEVKITINLDVKGKHIIGYGDYSKTKLKFNGGFFRDDYFYLNYENANPEIFQKGMMIFQWPNNPIEIKGQFLGIRRAVNEIASGKIELKLN